MNKVSFITAEECDKMEMRVMANGCTDRDFRALMNSYGAVCDAFEVAIREIAHHVYTDDGVKVWEQSASVDLIERFYDIMRKYHG